MSCKNNPSGELPAVQYSNYWDSGECSMCGTQISTKTRRAFVREYKCTTKKGKEKRNIEISQVCINCEMMNSAVMQAEEKSRRFTEVCVGIKNTHFGDYFGRRCLCGAASLSRLDLCVRCWREQRMLNRAQADIRSLIKMTTNLNRQIKDLQNGTQ